jgi:hypothetical protein
MPFFYLLQFTETAFGFQRFYFIIFFQAGSQSESANEMGHQLYTLQKRDAVYF